MTGRLLALALSLGLLAACADSPVDEGPATTDFLTSLTVVPNPFGFAPLTAEARIVASRPVEVEVVVAGRAGAEGEVRHRFPDPVQEGAVPILGLYAGHVNSVTLRFFDTGGGLLGDTVVSVATEPLPSAFPDVSVEVALPASMKPGMNLVSYFGHDGSFLPSRPFIFDEAGAVRWFLDFTGSPNFSSMFYDNGMERLANGNWYFGDRNAPRIVEMDMLGRMVAVWDLTGYAFHHQVLELPSGNLVATVNRVGEATVEDFLIEIDRGSGGIVREWDLRESLEVGRRAWPTSRADLNVDWFHANGIDHDPSDGTLIVSGRTQGTVKLTVDNEVVWILAPHRQWGRAGNGVDLSTKLLQPLDATGAPITDPAVLDGTAPHPDFEWPWYQHAPEVLPDGTLLVFDNGENRHYTGQPAYSRAVLYRIDAAAMTVQQLWEYGKERGTETFSPITSDVDYHAEEDNVVFMPGSVQLGDRYYGKTVEVDRATRSVVFEATIIPPIAPFGITFHRVERLGLYPEG